MEVFCRIVSAKRLHCDILLGDLKAVRDSLRHVFEYLLLRERIGEHERVIQRVQEANLDQGGVRRLLWNSTWRCDDVG